MITSNYQVYKNYKRKVELNYKFLPSDIQYTGVNMFILNFTFFAIRCLGVAVGLGGGFFIMGILLTFGQHPSVASSVIIYQGFILLGSSTLEYAVQGIL